jgi:hypothetical protein
MTSGYIPISKQSRARQPAACALSALIAESCNAWIATELSGVLALIALLMV